MKQAVGSVDANVRAHRATVVASREPIDGTTNPAKGDSPRRRDKSRAGDRWATLNAFVDVIAPRLTLAERAVWLVMFRHARDGVVQTSERQLATAARIDKATAGRALRQLVELRLAWPVMKSRSKESTSRYGLHPRPSACLSAVVAKAERRECEAQDRRQRNGGDRRGRRRKEQRTG